MRIDQVLLIFVNIFFIVRNRGFFLFVKRSFERIHSYLAETNCSFLKWTNGDGPNTNYTIGDDSIRISDKINTNCGWPSCWSTRTLARFTQFAQDDTARYNTIQHDTARTTRYSTIRLGSSGLLGHDTAAVSVVDSDQVPNNSKFQFKYSLNLIQIEWTKHKTYQNIKNTTENQNFTRNETFTFNFTRMLYLVNKTHVSF